MSDEINRTISGLRDLYPSDRYIDWHEDENWPTLLREMPAGTVRYIPEDMQWGVANDYSLIHEETEYIGEVEADELGEAVCLAWLKWKESR